MVHLFLQPERAKRELLAETREKVKEGQEKGSITGELSNLLRYSSLQSSLRELVAPSVYC